MNSQKISLTLFLLCLLSMPIFCFANGTKPSTDGTLSGSAIDLLVGTPGGVNEPLDARRTKIEKKDYDFSEYLKYDNAVEDSTAPEIDWDDEGTNNPLSDSDNSTYLDLISEVDEFDGEDFNELETNFDGNLSDSVETGIKL